MWGWAEAGDLGVGTSIVTRAGPPLVVKGVSWQRDETGKRPFTVYNLTVQGDHTYFAGNLDGGVWAHNSGGCPALKGDPYSPQAVKDRVLSPYEINPKHVPGSGSYIPGADVLPKDAEEAYAQAQQTPIGTWWAKGQGDGIAISQTTRGQTIVVERFRKIKSLHGLLETGDEMVFGDPQRFAVELELCPDPAGVWMNGRACYWISSERVGDFVVVDSLRDVLFCLERMSCDRDRTSEDLSYLSTEDLIDTLYHGLYNSSHSDQEVYYQRGIDGAWARHNINPGTAAFSEWVIFLVENGPTARCLYARNSKIALHGQERQLQRGEFNRTLEYAISYLLKEHKRLGGD